MHGLIINADDFGLSPAVNRGIVEAFQEGILTSTTLLANLPHFADAVELARADPELPVGVHLSLLWGPPVSNPDQVSTLVGKDGCFPRSLGVLARHYFLGSLSLEQVRIELGRQIRKVLDSGLVPTHLDTHKHIHCLPGILEAVISVAREYGIDKVRLPAEDAAGAHLAADDEARAPWQARTKRRLVKFLCRDARDRLQRSGIRTTDHFVGIEQMANLDADTLCRILRGLDRGVTELMCHPGYVDDEALTYSRTPPHRETELRGLCDPRLKARIASDGIRLMNYREL